jgi:L-fuculose-phosphate aldolase
MLLAEERAALCEIGRRMAEADLVVGAAGNASARSGDLVAVTPGGLPLDHLTPEDCPVVDLTGAPVEGARAPSSETPLHLALYEDTGARAVVHTHATYGAAVAATLTELPPVHYYTVLLGGVVQVAEYATYGTDALAHNVRRAMSGGMRAALLANHGAVTIGGDLPQALENAQLLEWLCGVYVRARSLGEPHLLTEDDLQRVLARGLCPPPL